MYVLYVYKERGAQMPMLALTEGCKSSAGAAASKACQQLEKHVSS
jgi:hypothetical protein